MIVEAISGLGYNPAELRDSLALESLAHHQAHHPARDEDELLDLVAVELGFDLGAIQDERADLSFVAGDFGGNFDGVAHLAVHLDGQRNAVFLGQRRVPGRERLLVDAVGAAASTTTAPRSDGGRWARASAAALPRSDSRPRLRPDPAACS